MKKVLFTALVTLGLVASFSGCSKKEEAPVSTEVNATTTEVNATEVTAPIEVNATEVNATEAK